MEKLVSFIAIIFFFSYSCEMKSSHLNKNKQSSSDETTELPRSGLFHNSNKKDTISKNTAKGILVDSTRWMNGEDTISSPQGEILFLNSRWEVINKESFLDSVTLSNYGSITLINIKQEKALKLIKIISYKEGNDPLSQDLAKYEDFSLTNIPDSLFIDLDGTIFSNAILDRKIVVLNFWFIGCNGCMQEIPFLNNIVEKYKNNKEVVFLAPSTDTPAELIRFSGKKKFKYRLVSAKDKFLTKGTFKINTFPTNMIIGKDGKVKYVSAGGSAVAVNLLDLALEKALNIENDERSLK